MMFASSRDLLLVVLAPGGWRTRQATVVRALESQKPPASGVAPISRDDAAVAPARERFLLCATCGHPIATERDRIAVLESHEHRFMNPAGHLFRIGCFARADGCFPVGMPSDEYPWFPGYAWRIVLCAGCAAHLGWRFDAPERTFFGLRLDQLRVQDGASPS